jgi:hypothetical protein
MQFIKFFRIMGFCLINPGNIKYSILKLQILRGYILQPLRFNEKKLYHRYRSSKPFFLAQRLHKPTGFL